MPGCAHLPYEATRASARAHLTRFTRRRVRKLALDSPLFAHVRAQLARGWPPDQIAERLRQEQPGCYGFTVSHETLYTALYALPRGELRRKLIGYLRQGHVHRWHRSCGTHRKKPALLPTMSASMCARRKSPTGSSPATGRAISSRAPPIARPWAPWLNPCLSGVAQDP